MPYSVFDRNFVTQKLPQTKIENEIFVSYSRRNSEFTVNLVNRLKLKDIDPWFDVDDIPKGRDWWHEIQHGISHAKVFVFLISRDSLQSMVCNWEVDYALTLSKKIVPILYEDVFADKELLHQLSGLVWDDPDGKQVNGLDNWQELASLNFIRYCDNENLDTSISDLIDNFETDYDYLEQHTRLLQRAIEWERRQKRASFLLRGDAILEAEQWLEYSVSQKPTASNLHREYIATSRVHSTKQKSILIFSAIVATLIITFAVLIGLQQTQRASLSDIQRATQQVIADSAQRNETAISIAVQAQNITLDDPTLALALALEANRLTGVNPPPRVERTLSEIAYSTGSRQRFGGHSGRINSVVYSPDGTRILSGGCVLDCQDGEMILWNASNGDIIRRYRILPDSIHLVAFSPSGQQATSLSGHNTMLIWDVETGEILNEFSTGSGSVSSAVYSPDGTMLLTDACSHTTTDRPCSSGALALWDVVTGELLRIFEGHDRLVSSVAFSHDGTTVLSGSSNGSILMWDAITGEILGQFLGHTGRVKYIEYSSDGATIVSSGCSDSNDSSGCGVDVIIRWDIASETELGRIDVNDVTSIAISPGGTKILTGSCDCPIGEIILWDLLTGQVLQRFSEQSGIIRSVAFGADDTTFLTGSDDIKIWITETGDLLHHFGGHNDIVRSVAITSDGATLLSGADDNTVLIWDVESNLVTHRLEGHSDQVTSVAFSPDDSYALSGALDNKVLLWDVETGELLKTFDGHDGFVLSVAFSPDGSHFLSGGCIALGNFGCDNGGMSLWDVETGELLKVFEGHDDTVLSVAFSPDGATILSSASDSTIILWDVVTGSILNNYDNSGSDAQSVAFSPDGTAMLSNSGVDVVLRDIATGEILQLISGHTDTVWSVAFSPDGETILSSSADNTLRLWNSNNGQILRVFQGHDDQVWSVAYAKNGNHVVSGSSDRTILLWETNFGAELERFESDYPNNIAYDSNTSTIALSRCAMSSCSQAEIVIINVNTDEVIQRFEVHTGISSDLVFSPDGTKILFNARDNVIRLLDITTGEVVQSFEGHTRNIGNIVFSSDGLRFISNSDRTIRLWDVNTGTELLHLDDHGGFVAGIAFNPDASIIASGGCVVDGSSVCQTAEMNLWDASNGEAILRVRNMALVLSSVEFSHDGRSILSGGCDAENSFSCENGIIILWDAENGVELQRLNDHGALVESVAFNTDSTQILSGSHDNTIRVWDVNSGEVLRTFEGHTGVIWAVNYGENGEIALSASSDNTVRIWRLDTYAQLLAWVERNLEPRSLLCDERKVYGLEPNCP